MILEHVAIAVSRLDRSIAFYEALGFRLLRRTPTNAFLYLDDDLIELIEGDLRPEPGASAQEEWQSQHVSAYGLNHLGFRVPRIAAALEQLEHGGHARLVVPPYEFVPELGFVEHASHERLALAARPRAGVPWKLAVVADPDGTLLEILER